MKRGVLLAVFTAFFFLSLASEAAPSCRDIKSLWRTQFKADFNANGDIDDSCTNSQAKFAQGLYVLHTSIPTLYRWAKGIIRETNVSDSASSEAMAQMAVSDARMTLFTNLYYQGSEQVAVTVVHEAGHIETPYHVECTRGAYSRNGKGWCDERFTESRSSGAFNHEFSALSDLLWAERAGHDIRASVVRARMSHLLLNSFNQVTPAQVERWDGSIRSVSGGAPIRTAVPDRRPTRTASDDIQDRIRYWESRGYRP